MDFRDEGVKFRKIILLSCSHVAGGLQITGTVFDHIGQFSRNSCRTHVPGKDQNSLVRYCVYFWFVVIAQNWVLEKYC